MDFSKLTPDAIRSLDIAVQSARDRQNVYVDVEHLLIGVLATDAVRKAFASISIDVDAMTQSIGSQLSIVREEPLAIKEMRGLTKDAQKAIDRAGDIARTLSGDHMSSGALALSIIAEPTPFIDEILTQYPTLDIKLLTEQIEANSSRPTRTFQQKWSPGSWENGRVLRSGGSKSTRTARAEGNQPPARTAQDRRPNSSDDFWTNNAPIFAALALLAGVLYGAMVAPNATIAVVIVAGGWIVSLVLHEFAHALVAYWGGDTGVAERGYLTLNPLKYTHPLLSIVLPLFFLAIGGIGLPGGAVYIDRSRLRNKYFGSLVSAAGPFANAICLIIFSAPFWTGYVTLENYFQDQIQWGSLAFLCFLQVMAIMFNLIPFPPLDGFGIIEPFLPDDIAIQLRSLGMFGLILILAMFWIPEDAPLNPGTEFLNTAESITYSFDIEPGMPGDGYRAFRFWD